MSAAELGFKFEIDEAVRAQFDGYSLIGTVVGLSMRQGEVRAYRVRFLLSPQISEERDVLEIDLSSVKAVTA